MKIILILIKLWLIGGMIELGDEVLLHWFPTKLNRETGGEFHSRISLTRRFPNLQVAISTVLWYQQWPMSAGTKRGSGGRRWRNESVRVCRPKEVTG